jgi:hypothetical protein
MPKGPHEARLDTYVAGGSVSNIRHAAQVWDKGQKVLEDLATALDSAKPHLMNRFGPQTGPAAVAAFAKVAHNVRSQAAEMQKAVSALKSAGDALEDAQTMHQHLGNAPASPPADPSQKAGETAEAFHLRQRDTNAAQSHYASVLADRESKSQQATQDVDTKYEHAISVMENIHGQPRTTTGGGGAGGGGAVPGGALPPGPGRTNGGGHRPTVLTGGHVTDGTHTGGTDTGGGTTTAGGTDTGGTDAPPTYGDPGASQGPGHPGGTPYPGDPGETTPPGGLPSGTTGPTGPSATSTAVGGVLSGGILGGTSSLSSAMRSTVSSGMLSRSALSAEEQALLASRATGTSGATGAATAGRGGAVGMTGSGRGGAGGAGAGGRGDRGRKKKKANGVDFFEDNDDWVDDDEAAPGVLD